MGGFKKEEENKKMGPKRLIRQSSKVSNFNDFHSDSVWTVMEQTCENSSSIISGGRDGNIFETNL